MGQRFSLQPMTAEDVARARQWLQAQPPPAVPSSRQILESIDPMAGPTRAREETPVVSPALRASLVQGRLGRDVGAVMGNAAVQTLGGLIGALDRRPTGLPDGVPYTTPLRMVSAAQATVPAAAGAFADALMNQPTPPGAGVVDPLRPVEEHATFANEARAREASPWLQAAATVADYLPTGPEDVVAAAKGALAAKALTGGASMAAAGWFPKKFRKLSADLDAFRSEATAAQKAAHLASGKPESTFQLKGAEIDAGARKIIREYAKSPADAQRLEDAYNTIALPVYRGINFDDRRPLSQVLTEDARGTATTTSDLKARGVKLAPWSEQRVAAAYDAGVERAALEDWDDARWVYHLTDGDPTTAAKLSRLFGAFSPGQKTDANTLNAIEAFLRSARGESVDDILGPLVKDADTGEMTRMGGSLSFKHPRPNTVQDNLERAVLLGRLFDDKVEAMSGSMVGFHDKIPIDMWLMRAIGAQSDATPGTGYYRLISEAMAKEAAKRGENPFQFMAKTWMGMQAIAGSPTPSFSSATARLRLPGHLRDAAAGDRVLGNLDVHSAAIRTKDTPDTGEVMPIATNPARMPYEAWLDATQALMRQGTTRDVLGKKRVTTPRDVTYASKMADEATQQARTVTNMLHEGDMWSPAQQPTSWRVPVVSPTESMRTGAAGREGVYQGLSDTKAKRVEKQLQQASQDDTGASRLLRAVYGDNAGDTTVGRGDWPAGGVRERNRMSGYVANVPIRNNAIAATDEAALRAIGSLEATANQQRGSAYTAFVPKRLVKEDVPLDMVHVQLPKNVTLSDADLDALSQRLGGSQHIIQDFGKSINVLRFDAAVDKAYGDQVGKAVEGVIGQSEGVTHDIGRNAVSASTSYRDIPQGAVGSRVETNDLMQTLAQLPPAVQRKLNSRPVRQWAQAKLDVLVKSRSDIEQLMPDRLNYLRAIAKGGVTELAKQLQDPNTLLPVLAALGFGSVLRRSGYSSQTASASPQGRTGG
jgi:hypothetical protein